MSRPLRADWVWTKSVPKWSASYYNRHFYFSLKAPSLCSTNSPRVLVTSFCPALTNMTNWYISGKHDMWHGKYVFRVKSGSVLCQFIFVAFVCCEQFTMGSHRKKIKWLFFTDCFIFITAAFIQPGLLISSSSPPLQVLWLTFAEIIHMWDHQDDPSTSQ